jgi:hypothetical protein
MVVAGPEGGPRVLEVLDHIVHGDQVELRSARRQVVWEEAGDHLIDVLASLLGRIRMRLDAPNLSLRVGGLELLAEATGSAADIQDMQGVGRCEGDDVRPITDVRVFLVLHGPAPPPIQTTET